MPAPPFRIRSLLEALLPLALGALALARGHALAGGGLLGFGGALLLAAFAAPWLGLALRHFMRRLGRYLAAGLAWLLLAAVHLLVFTPAGLLLRLTGRDPLAPRFPSDQPSYWAPRPPVDPARIRRTF